MLSEKVKEKYLKWLNSNRISDEEKIILKNMSEEEIDDAFFKDIEFGTGGLRGKMGPGTNRINAHLIKKLSIGYGNFLIKSNLDLSKGVVISHDNRKNSREYALLVSDSLNEIGINTYIFDSLRPTPELSFAVRAVKALGGIMITASHNPKTDNGFKLYNEVGTQLVPSEIEPIINEINLLGDVLDFSYKKSKIMGFCKVFDKKIDEEYVNMVLKIRLDNESKKLIKVLYSSNHGASLNSVKEVLTKANYSFEVFKEFESFDPEFSGCDAINPEEKNSYIKPIKRAKEIGADIILMNDPDGDRVGVAALHNNEYVLLSGNESANLLLDYILMKRKENGTLKENSIVFNTVVTSHLGKKICDSYGVKLESFLTGFKYIGERIHYYETNGNVYNFVFGYEESDGCLISKEVRDKDGTQAILLYTELANYYKNMGLDLVEAYKNLEKKYGFYKSKLFNIYLRGENGKDEIIRILNEIRNDPILKIGDRTVTKIIDYKKQKIYEINNNIIKDYKELPISDVIKFVFSDDSNIEIRPSGTEPKCKFYIELSSTNYILEEEIDNIFNFLRKKYKF
ncbi:MAG: phospho-sugar mutase [bacterium]|nr:phospho-sugar mutase [bacterium]